MLNKDAGLLIVVVVLLAGWPDSAALCQTQHPVVTNEPANRSTLSSSPKTNVAPDSPPAAPLTSTPSPEPSTSSIDRNDTIKLGPGQIVVIPQLPSAKSETPGIVGTIVWPITVIILALLFAYNARLGRLLGLVPKFLRKIEGPGGITLEINPEAAKEVQNYFNSSFDELMSKAQDEYNQMAKMAQVRDKLGEVINVGLRCVLLANLVPHRAAVRGTIHVPDIVFSEFLYQLVDYYPIAQGRKTAGRRFSQRFGIIGRAWRLKESVGKGNALPVPPLGATPDELAQWQQRTKRMLIEDWGMFEEEAAPGSHGRPAYLCVILRSSGAFEGVLFWPAPGSVDTRLS